ncbi:MAG: substrate-binding domain-containing protein [Bryobacterales bacterium]|nr:substrate-binding domain-containing protein [Bryobacterales bacterium]
MYYLVAANTKIAYWQDAEAGLTEAARLLGVRAEMVGPETYDPKAEREEFVKLLSRNPKPAGILVSAADPNLMQDAIDQAIAAGVPVVTMDSDSPKSKRLMFIGTDNYEAGRMGAEVVAKALNGRGNVAVYTIAGQENLIERLEGYKRVFARYPQISIVQTVDIHGDPTAAFDATKKIAEQKTQPDAFVCLEALACQEVADVLSRANITGKTIVAMDTDKDTLEWIGKGVIRATIVQKPFTMASYGLRVLDDLQHNKLKTLDADWSRQTHSPLPVFIDTGATLLDQNNLKAYMDAGQS